MFENADLIHRYTRAEAVRDGVPIDVSETAREAGVRWPVALTAAAWERCVTVPPGVVCQDEAGRLWDVVYLLRCAIRRSQVKRPPVLPEPPAATLLVRVSPLAASADAWPKTLLA